MRELFNYIINILFGVKLRYKGRLIYGNKTNFLRSFSLIGINGKDKICFGDNCLIGASFIAETPNAQFKIGNNVYMGKSTVICKEGIVFGNNILVAWGVMFYDHNSHSIDFNLRRQDLSQVVDDFQNFKGNYLKNKNWDIVKGAKITIGDDAWIGFNATILKGVTIGEGAIVAACSVVVSDVPPFTVVAGNPAKVIKELNK